MGPWTKAYCDSCGIKMFECAQIHWDEGQELILTPLLCEKCGRKHNLDVGDDVQHLMIAEKLLRKLGTSEYNFKYIGEDGNEIK